VSTTTPPAFAGRVSADGKAHKVQVFAEAARAFALNESLTVSPYLNVAQVWLRSDAIRETATDTAAPTALEVVGQSDSVRVTTLGARAAVTLPTQTPIQVMADLGWARIFGDTNAATSNRFAGCGKRFAIRGVGVDKNAALVGLGLQAQITPNASLSVGYQGEFGSNVRSHTGQVQFRMRF